MKTMRSNILLVVTALIWGLSFVAQSVGMDYVGPFTFIAVRTLLGGVILIPVVYLMKGLKRKEHTKEKQVPENRKMLYLGGVCCGLALFVGTSLQQIGIMSTSVGKAGFITALYIIIVPILGLFLKKSVGKKLWVSVVVAIAGMYLLCVTEGFSINKGDLFVFVGAIAFSFHILIIDYFSPHVDGVKLSCIQFFTCAILAGIVMFIVEEPKITNILAAWQPIAYAGFMSCGVAYTLQIIAQKNTDPVVASLILSLESVFACIFGFFILHEILTEKEAFGCILVFIGIIIAQLPKRSEKNVNEVEV